MRPLRLALAQGLLLNDALGALRAIGIDVSRITPGGRRLVVDGGDLEFVLARPSDIATYVERGAADLGIVGKDVLMETGARVVELVDLRFGACRFVVAAPRGAVDRALDEYRHLGSLEVATKYPRVASSHFRVCRGACGWVENNGRSRGGSAPTRAPCHCCTPCSASRPC